MPSNSNSNDKIYQCLNAHIDSRRILPPDLELRMCLVRAGAEHRRMLRLLFSRIIEWGTLSVTASAVIGIFVWGIYSASAVGTGAMPVVTMVQTTLNLVAIIFALMSGYGLFRWTILSLRRHRRHSQSDSLWIQSSPL